MINTQPRVVSRLAYPKGVTLTPEGLVQALKWARGTLGTLVSVWHFVRAFSHLRYHVAEDGCVSVSHAKTGSMVQFRADGNVDMFPARHANLQTGGYVLLNSPEKDKEEFSQKGRS